ncbi:lytic transglycosylase domain-containing protein [Azospirillum sp. B4]|uniref:lytic transglycosylase domain-containing protein n=1 Tax=Azospirillum sp. B4 TaxID=95605 RepID=UPI0011DE231B|nr:lytic transglycosylase domain-containing protein [Azospirillum sp. B4]
MKTCSIYRQPVQGMVRRAISAAIISGLPCVMSPGLAATPMSDRGACGLAMDTVLEAGRRLGQPVPSWVLNAMIKLESGYEPWALNVARQRVYPTPSSRQEAVRIAEAALKEGKSVDVGCSQLNIRWHGAQFSRLEEMLDPVSNVAYAASTIRDLARRHQWDWGAALGYYHNSDALLRAAYLCHARHQINHAVNCDRLDTNVARRRSNGPGNPSPTGAPARLDANPATEGVIGSVESLASTRARAIAAQFSSRPPTKGRSASGG